MRAYLEQLQKQTDNIKPVTKTRNEEYIPLETQIQQLMASLPENMQQRNWSMDDLIIRLNGKYRDKPHAQKVGEALRRLGWTRHRDCSRAGGGIRVWRLPQYKSRFY